MSTGTLSKEMKKAKQFAAFLTDVAEVMSKHKVKDMVCFFGMKGEFRNTYIPLGENGEDKLYCNISDAINAWLTQSVQT